MKRYVYILVAVLTIGLFSHVLARDAAAVNIFVKVDGLDGESTEKNHEKWIDAVSVSHKIHRVSGSAMGATRTRGSATFEDFVVVKRLDKSSPILNLICASGQVIPKVEIEYVVFFRDSGPVTVMKYELKNVMVTSVSIAAASPVDVLATETVTLSFEEIKAAYTEMDRATGRARGNVEFSWKVERDIM